MSDKTSTTDPLSSPLLDQPDWFLQSLVNMANKDKIEIGLTLQVSGFLVSGVLVSGARYFEGFGEDFSQGASPESAASIKSSFAKYGDIYEGNISDQPPPQYIHLKNARFFHTTGNPIPGNKGVWWRGRLFEVGGFSLGTLSADGN